MVESVFEPKMVLQKRIISRFLVSEKYAKTTTSNSAKNYI